MLRSVFCVTLATFLLASCGVLDGRSCNLMYAPSGVTVEFQAQAWAPGTWEVEVDGLSCTVLLDPDATPSGQVACDDAATPRLEILLSPSSATIDSAWLIESTPDVLTVKLTHDGTVVLDDELVPEYAVDEPNGRGCGERRAATVSVSVEGGG